MAMPAFRSPSSLYAERNSPATIMPAGRERLAIISSSSKLCGIAAYTAALRRQLEGAFEITVFDLDQYLMRHLHRRVRKIADRHIKEICRDLQAFDAVNLQLEHGTLGRRASDITRRFCWLTEAAPRLSVTFHTMVLPPSFDGAAFAKTLATMRFKDALRMQRAFGRNHRLSVGIARQLRRLQRGKQISAIVHNRRDRRDLHYLFGVRHVFDHPLSYLAADEVAAIRAGASRPRFPTLDALPEDSVLIGLFGFLNEYKGIATAIQALKHLPQSHHLLIFGGIHPHEIVPRQPRHPYLSSLLGEAHVDATLFDGLREPPAAVPLPQLVLTSDQGVRGLLDAHPRDVSARVHFMGALAEDDFLNGMAICDAVVFPYLEVGQSSSGPISQALELGCRIIASRTHAFLEFAEYHPDTVEFFDIGNHLELAERLRARGQFSLRAGLPEFNVESNKATYLLANSRIGSRLHQTRPARAFAAAGTREEDRL